jgi:hypothetical protein
LPAIVRPDHQRECSTPGGLATSQAKPTTIQPTNPLSTPERYSSGEPKPEQSRPSARRSRVGRRRLGFWGRSPGVGGADWGSRAANGHICERSEECPFAVWGRSPAPRSEQSERPARGRAGAFCRDARRETRHGEKSQRMNVDRQATAKIKRHLPVREAAPKG